MTKKWILVGLVFVVGSLSACTPPGEWLPVFAAAQPVVEPAGEPGRGEQLFRVGVADAPPCSGCHLVEVGGMGLALGPNLAGIASEAADRVAGMTAEDYLVESIFHPKNHVIPGYRVSMFEDYAAYLSPEDTADLLAYLMTLAAAP